MNVGTLETTKEDKQAHGFGLDTVRNIASKHQGTAEFILNEEGIFVANVTVML